MFFPKLWSIDVSYNELNVCPKWILISRAVIHLDLSGNTKVGVVNEFLYVRQKITLYSYVHVHVHVDIHAHVHVCTFNIPTKHAK